MNDGLLISLAALAAAVFEAYRIGVKRGREEARLDSSVFVTLPCFGGPFDGLTIRFPETSAYLNVNVQDICGSQLRTCTYVRLWMGDREQLVYQGTVGG